MNQYISTQSGPWEEKGDFSSLQAFRHWHQCQTADLMVSYMDPSTVQSSGTQVNCCVNPFDSIVIFLSSHCKRLPIIKDPLMIKYKRLQITIIRSTALLMILSQGDVVESRESVLAQNADRVENEVSRFDPSNLSNQRVILPSFQFLPPTSDQAFRDLVEKRLSGQTSSTSKAKDNLLSICVGLAMEMNEYYTKQKVDMMDACERFARDRVFISTQLKTVVKFFEEHLQTLNNSRDQSRAFIDSLTQTPTTSTTRISKGDNDITPPQSPAQTRTSTQTRSPTDASSSASNNCFSSPHTNAIMLNTSPSKSLDADRSLEYARDMSLQLPSEAEDSETSFDRRYLLRGAKYPSLSPSHPTDNSRHPDILQSPRSFSFEDEDADLFIDNGVWEEPQSSVADARAVSDEAASPATSPSPKAHRSVKVKARIVKEEVGWVDDSEKWSDGLLAVNVIQPLPPRSAINTLGTPLPSPNPQQSAVPPPNPFFHLTERPLFDDTSSVGLGIYNRNYLNMPGLNSQIALGTFDEPPLTFKTNDNSLDSDASMRSASHGISDVSHSIDRVFLNVRDVFAGRTFAEIAEGEGPWTMRLLCNNWPPLSPWCVINMFDELDIAGVSFCLAFSIEF